MTAGGAVPAAAPAAIGSRGCQFQLRPLAVHAHGGHRACVRSASPSRCPLTRALLPWRHLQPQRFRLATRTGVAIGCLYLSPQNVQGHFPRVPHTLLLRVARDGLIFPGWKGSALSSSPAAHPPPFPHQTASLRTTSKQSLSHCSCSQRAQMHVFLPDSLLLP